MVGIYVRAVFACCVFCGAMSWLFDFSLAVCTMWYLTTRRVQLVSFQPTTRRYFVELLVRAFWEVPSPANVPGFTISCALAVAVLTQTR
jgi:hypothetical protein